MRATLLAPALLVAATACGRHAPARGAPDAIALARELERAVELELPPSSRPGGRATPAGVVVPGPFQLVRKVGDVAVYGAPLPIRPRTLFFNEPPAGLVVRDRAGRSLAFSKGASNPEDTWTFTATTLVLRRARDAGPPRVGDYRVEYPPASARERALNLAESVLEPRAFAARSLQLDTETRTGLLLPAPARVAWDLDLPRGAVLVLDATVLPPELAEGGRSDGATLVCELELDERRHELARLDLAVGEWTPLRVDLARFGGAHARLRLSTEPGASATLDYAFVAEPTLYRPKAQPRRFVIAFADTLRPDHLGAYGYARETSPRLDRWARGAALFENARSVAPWTLPSARSLLSGRQPERWAEAPTLPERLARAGWATAAFTGNAYLSSSFDMARGWGLHTCDNAPQAEVQVERAAAFLRDHADRDALVLVHTMETHLPYAEPERYRALWVGPGSAELPDGADRPAILRAARADRASVRRYVIDRYDQNVRALDDALGTLFERQGERATLVLVSDHGEEFWEHDGFEHGHTLYDELLRIPLAISSPDLPPARITAPVSILDLTPTLLELAGLPQAPTDGLSLVPLARDRRAAADPFEARTQAFGRPLYGRERWGTLHGHVKWTTHEGDITLYDLASDPRERHDLAAGDAPLDVDALRQELARALRREVPLAWRLTPSRTKTPPTEEQVIELTHPEGLRAAWLAPDPMGLVDAHLEGPDEEGRVHLTLPAAQRAAPVVLLVPAGDPTHYATLELRTADQTAALEPHGPARLPTGTGSVLGKADLAGRRFTLTYAFAPTPEGGELDAMDAELREDLRALGYAGEDEDE